VEEAETSAGLSLSSIEEKEGDGERGFCRRGCEEWVGYYWVKGWGGYYWVKG